MQLSLFTLNEEKTEISSNLFVGFVKEDDLIMESLKIFNYTLKEFVLKLSFIKTKHNKWIYGFLFEFSVGNFYGQRNNYFDKTKFIPSKFLIFNSYEECKKYILFYLKEIFERELKINTPTTQKNISKKVLEYLLELNISQ